MWPVYGAWPPLLAGACTAGWLVSLGQQGFGSRAWTVVVCGLLLLLAQFVLGIADAVQSPRHERSRS